MDEQQIYAQRSKALANDRLTELNNMVPSIQQIIAEKQNNISAEIERAVKSLVYDIRAIERAGTAAVKVYGNYTAETIANIFKAKKYPTKIIPRHNNLYEIVVTIPPPPHACYVF
jgi:sialic acid synthase SpsE